MATFGQCRLIRLLESLGKCGLTQQQIAAKAGLPAQYLSDIKHGRRPMTELVARRLAQAFQVNFEWLLGSSDIQEVSLLRPRVGGAWLPLFSHPVTGDPQGDPGWTGAGVELSGAAAAKVSEAHLPYILQFGHDDVQGRLRAGDLILISQSSDASAAISVVRHQKKLFLARPQPNGTWKRVANGNSLPASCAVVGHCVGIVWSSLMQSPPAT